MTIDVADFVSRIRSVVGESATPIGLHEPEVGELEKQYLADCIDSTFVSSVGAYIPEFEQRIQEITGAKYAVAASNGTSALHIALYVVGVESGDEVIVPTLSFVATANAVAHAGAVPHFIDSELSTMGMSPEKLRERLSKMERRGGKVYNPETGARIAAISPMHTLGHPVRIKEIVAIADEYGIPVVEDAAESLGSFVDGQHTGTFCLTVMISFNGNKIVTTGGGGVIITNDETIAKRAKHITTTAKLPHKWEFEHDELAWNYRMTNLTAALGMAQLTKLDRFLDDKRIIAQAYADIFADFEGAKFVFEPEGTSSNYWLCAVQLDEPSIAKRDELMQACHDVGIMVRPMWNLLHTQKMYLNAPAAEVPTATALHASLICLPSSPRLARR
jgi:perosamine synthetase